MRSSRPVPADREQLLLEGLYEWSSGVFLLDKSLKVFWVNGWLEKRLPESPWVGRTLAEIFRESQRGGEHPAVGRLLEKGRVSWFLESAPAGGANSRLGVSVSVLRSESGSLKGAIGKVEDLGDWLGTERRLLEEADRRKVLVEQSPDGIVVLEETGEVYEANRHFAEMLGYTLEEIYQLRAWDWDVKFGREEVLRMLGLANEQGHHVRTQHRHKDGAVLEVEMSTNGSSFVDRKLIFCVCRDITERCREEERQERRIQELQRAVLEMAGVSEKLALCAFCKKVRNDEGAWEDVEVFLAANLHRLVSHGICPGCVKEHYSGLNL